MLTRNDNARLISWQEFRTQYLERGEVDRLQVINKNVVRVYLRRDNTATRTSGVSGGIGGERDRMVGEGKREGGVVGRRKREEGWERVTGRRGSEGREVEDKGMEREKLMKGYTKC